MEPVGHRLVFDELPATLRRCLEDRVGAEVVGAENRRGGYSPSVAARYALSDGRVVFVKAVSPDQNPDSPDILRREAAISAVLPPAAPAPRILDVIDDGFWILAVYEFVAGDLPRLPWSGQDLAQVLDATWSLSEIAPPGTLPTAVERYGSILNGWRNLAADPRPPRSLDCWSTRHLERLAEMEPAWEEAASG
jgi:hypothetical protein